MASPCGRSPQALGTGRKCASAITRPTAMQSARSTRCGMVPSSSSLDSRILRRTIRGRCAPGLQRRLEVLARNLGCVVTLNGMDTSEAIEGQGGVGMTAQYAAHRSGKRPQTAQMLTALPGCLSSANESWRATARSWRRRCGPGASSAARSWRMSAKRTIIVGSWPGRCGRESARERQQTGGDRPFTNRSQTAASDPSPTVRCLSLPAGTGLKCGESVERHNGTLLPNADSACLAAERLEVRMAVGGRAV
jgi:hypothetical protein